MKEFLTLHPAGHRGVWAAFASSMRRRVLAGALVVTPFIIGFLPVLLLYPKLESLGSRFPGYNEDNAQWVAVAVALIFVLAALYLIGLFSATIAMRFLMRMGEKVLNQIPVVNWCYRMTKQVVDLVAIGTSKPFQRVVIIEYPRRGIFSMGFVTGESIHMQGAKPLVHIFLPTTPNPTSGLLMMLPPEDVLDANIPVEMAVKFIISGGILQTGDMNLTPYAFGSVPAQKPPQAPAAILAGETQDDERTGT